MSANRLGIGIIGAGAIADMHTEAYLRLGNECEIVAVADLDASKAQSLIDRYGLGARPYADYRELLARGDVDAVSVCTPPSIREGPIVDALMAGKHVMSEKPFAASLGECDRMLTAAERSGRQLAVMLQTRFDLSVRRLRHLVVSGALGPVLYASAYNHHWRGDEYYRKPWRGTWERERGGALMNLGIHTLDALLWILGAPERVQAEAGVLGHDIETDDVAAAVLKFPDGAIAHFASTTVFPADASALRLSGKSRMAAYPAAYAAMKPSADGYPVADPEGVAELARLAAEVEPAVDGFAGPIADWFESVRSGREPVTAATRVRPTLETVTAIYKSAVTRRSVTLPILPGDPWYETDNFHERMRKHRLHSRHRNR